MSTTPAVESAHSGDALSKRPGWRASGRCGSLVAAVLLCSSCSRPHEEVPAVPGRPGPEPETAAPVSPIPGYGTRRAEAALESELLRLDPVKDEWDTEAF